MNLTLTGLVLGSIELNPAFYPTVEEYTAHYDPNEVTSIGAVSATKADADAYIGSQNAGGTTPVPFFAYREIGQTGGWYTVNKVLAAGTNPETSTASFSLEGKDWELQFSVYKAGVTGSNLYKVFLYADE